MRALVAKTDDVWSLLPTWSPGGSEDVLFANHIKSLRIPTVENGQPSLVLHRLGEGEGGDERLKKVFSFAKHTCVT